MVWWLELRGVLFRSRSVNNGMICCTSKLEVASKVVSRVATLTPPRASKAPSYSSEWKLVITSSGARQWPPQITFATWTFVDCNLSNSQFQSKKNGSKSAHPDQLSFAAETRLVAGAASRASSRTLSMPPQEVRAFLSRTTAVPSRGIGLVSEWVH